MLMGGGREGGREPRISFSLVCEKAEGLGEGILMGKYMIQAGEVMGGLVGRALEREYQDRDTISIREVAQEMEASLTRMRLGVMGFWAGKKSARMRQVPARERNLGRGSFQESGMNDLNWDIWSGQRELQTEPTALVWGH